MWKINCLLDRIQEKRGDRGRRRRQDRGVIRYWRWSSGGKWAIMYTYKGTKLYSPNDKVRWPTGKLIKSEKYINKWHVKIHLILSQCPFPYGKIFAPRGAHEMFRGRKNNVHHTETKNPSFPHIGLSQACKPWGLGIKKHFWTFPSRFLKTWGCSLKHSPSIKSIMSFLLSKGIN